MAHDEAATPLAPEERMDVAPGEVEPGAGSATLNLTEPHKTELAETLCKILDSHDSAMSQRIRRWRKIEEAYNLRPDSEREGQRPDASSLVSEQTRSATNVATSQLVEALIGTKDGLFMTQVADDQATGQDTVAAVEFAERIDEFLEAYSLGEMNLPKELYKTIHGLCKLGSARVQVMWEVEEKKYAYRDATNKIQRETDRRGGVRWRNIPLRNAVSWPLSETDLQKALVVGHKTYMEHFEFRAFAKRLNVPDRTIKEILGEKTSDETEGYDETDEELERNLKDQDINVGSEITKCYGFVVPTHRKLLWCDYNPLLYQGVPYFNFAYWEELEAVHGSGVGDESLYPQAADSAMWNMYIDNLKIISNFQRIFKAGSTAEAMRDEVGPGRDLVTEDPEGDVAFTPLGADLKEMHDAMDRNDYRQMRATGINAPTQGFADPVLKSGASPGSYMQLIAQANKKFKQIDLNIRAELARAFMFVLELLQQYAPQGIYFNYVSDETAQVVSSLHFLPPKGNLSKRFRIMVRPPSAASNREMLRMNLMLIQNQTLQYASYMVQLAESTYGMIDPGKVFMLKEQILVYLNEIYKELLEVHEVPGLSAKAPTLQETPEDVLVSQLLAQIAQLRQQLEMVMYEAANAGAGLEQPGSEQGFPQALPVAAGQ
jgi:hypothetical protein